MAKVGAPSRYKPEYIGMVERLAKVGMTDQQMADIFGVALSTFNLWKKKHPEFSDANARGKVDPNALVEKSLLQRAVGGFFIKKTVRGPDGEIMKVLEEEIPADVTAATKWLFNRDPDRWRDKQEIEHTGSIDMTTLTPEEFEKRKAALLARGGEKK